MTSSSVIYVYILPHKHKANLIKYVKHLYKGVRMSPSKIAIFADLNRAGHDKSVKEINVLAQIFTKLWAIYELHNYIILIVIINIIINITIIV